MRELLRRAAGRRVTVGFDGFIDTIARRSRAPRLPTHPRSILSLSRRSGSIWSSTAAKAARSRCTSSAASWAATCPASRPVQVTTSTVQAALRCSPGYPTATVSTLPVSLPRLMYPRAAPRRWTKCWMRCKTRKKRERKRVLSFLFEHAQNRYRKSRPDRDGFDDLFYALCSMQCAQVPWATRV